MAAGFGSGDLIAPRLVAGQQIDSFEGINVPLVYRVKSESEAQQPFGVSSAKALIS